jgi:hypothetical protein
MEYYGLKRRRLELSSGFVVDSWEDFAIIECSIQIMLLWNFKIILYFGF